MNPFKFDPDDPDDPDIDEAEYRRRCLKKYGEVFRCPCCGYRTLPERCKYLICRVCFWEDDRYTEQCPDSCCGPNYPVSLTQARLNFKEFGACERKMLEHVRKPKPEEI